jgi:hypothetical protein
LDCCGTDAAGPCNGDFELDRTLTIVSHFDHMASSVCDFNTVTREIDGKRPLGLRVGWFQGGGHFVAIGAYSALQGQRLHIEDPWWGVSDDTYNKVKGRYLDLGSWTHTYWTRA